MDFDFEFFLVLATALSGIIWGGYLALGRFGVLDIGGQKKEPLLVEYAHSFFPVLFVVMILRSFIVEPFRIPSGSMMPTLLIGDFILVNKFTYGVRLPVANKKIIDVGEPQRGDIVVFRFPQDPSVDYIKRIVGLPGDRIAYYNKQVYVNGRVASQTRLGSYVGTGKGSTMTGAIQLNEELTGVVHDILIRDGQPTVQGEFTVPPGNYFVMGDNRDNSNDSRYWGTVPEGNLVGKAFLIWMNWDWDNGGVALARLGTTLK
jgi:signal peptidase I